MPLEKILPGLTHIPNLHPIFVHFPIAFWAGAALFLTLGALRRRDHLFDAGRWLLYLGTASAGVAVATGLWAADTMGHDSAGHELVHVHRNIMLAASGLGFVAALAAATYRESHGTAAKWAITALMWVTLALLTLGADRGAALVFRHGIGVAPEVLSDEDRSHADDRDLNHDHAHDSR